MSRVSGGVSRLAVVVAVAGLGLSTLAAGSAAAYSQPSNVTAECPAPAAGAFECMALVRNDLTPSTSGPVGGYGPSDLQSAYNLTSAASTSGSGTTVAIVEEGDDPNAVSDFNAYRLHYGLPACDSTTEAGCLTVAHEGGSRVPPAANAAWAVQSSMDADTVAAICPNCHVLLVEAASPDETDMMDSVGSAVNTGARIVVLGYGDPDTSQSQSVFEGLVQRGVTVVAAAGDNGYGTRFPAASQYVTAVGGTTLTQDSSSPRGWDESVWAGTGAGCAAAGTRTSWQTGTGCAGRTQNDVAADADPATGVAFYDTDGTFGGWGDGGGTNVSAAIVGAVYALAGLPEGYTYPAEYPYLASSGLYPVTSGSDGTCTITYLCTAGPGYNGPAGLGTPDGTTAFAAPSSPLIGESVVRVGSYTAGQSTTELDPSTEQLEVWDSALAAKASVFSAAGLPPGLSLSANGCATQYCLIEIYGTPTRAGNYSVTVTDTDANGVTGTITFPVHVQDFVAGWNLLHENVTIGTAVNVPVNVTSASAGETLNFSVTGLPPGISWTQTGPDQLTFAGTPTTAGNYTSNVTASNPYGGSVTEPVTWAVHGTITLKAQANMTGTVGGSGVSIIAAADSVAGAKLYYAWQGLPPGVNALEPISNWAAGWLAKAGTYHVTLGVSDQYGAGASESFTWTVTDSASTQATGPVPLDLAGKCLDDPASKTANGTRPDIWTCNSGANQRWAVAQDGSVRVLGKCLDIKGNGTANGTAVDLWTCNGGTNQRWQAGAGAELINPQSGKCLDDPASKTANATQLDIWSCNGGKNQRWTLPAGPLESGIAGMCLADPGNVTANGTRLKLWQCEGWNEEKFTFAADGTIRIHGKCVYVNPNPNANPNTLSPAMLEACTSGNKGEQWGFSSEAPFGGTLYNQGSGNNLGVLANTAANGTAVGTAGGTQQAGFSWRAA